MQGHPTRHQVIWAAEGIGGRFKFLPLAWAGMPKTSFRKNSDSLLKLEDLKVTDFAVEAEASQHLDTQEHPQKMPEDGLKK